LKRAISLVLGVIVTLSVVGCGARVPDVSGDSIGAAKRTLTGAGFSVGTVAYDVNATGPQGRVVDQDPAAGSRVDGATAVTLTLAGPEPVVVPSVLGLDQNEGEARIVGLGLAVEAAPRSYDASIPAGHIVSQSPTAGVLVAGKSGITLVVSKGPAPVEVPKANGSRENKARKRLYAAGFKVKIKRKYSSTRSGVVIGQQPSYGHLAKRGSVVYITVSRGPAPVSSASSTSGSRREVHASAAAKAAMSALRGNFAPH